MLHCFISGISTAAEGTESYDIAASSATEQWGSLRLCESEGLVSRRGRRNELAIQIAFLKIIGRVAEFLKTQNTIAAMPRGVRLVRWNLKEPPVCLELYSVVTDSAKFAKSTLGQMKILLENPKARVGWTMAQLIDRLAQVGVTVALELGEAHPAEGPSHLE